MVRGDRTPYIPPALRCINLLLTTHKIVHTRCVRVVYREIGPKSVANGLAHGPAATYKYPHRRCPSGLKARLV